MKGIFMAIYLAEANVDDFDRAIADHRVLEQDNANGGSNLHNGFLASHNATIQAIGAAASRAREAGVALSAEAIRPLLECGLTTAEIESLRRDGVFFALPLEAGPMGIPRHSRLGGSSIGLPQEAEISRICEPLCKAVELGNCDHLYFPEKVSTSDDCCGASTLANQLWPIRDLISEEVNDNCKRYRKFLTNPRGVFAPWDSGNINRPLVLAPGPLSAICARALFQRKMSNVGFDTENCEVMALFPGVVPLDEFAKRISGAGVVAVLPDFPDIHLNVLASFLKKMGGYNDVVLHYLRFDNEEIRNSIEALQHGARFQERFSCELMTYLRAVTRSNGGGHA